MKVMFPMHYTVNKTKVSELTIKQRIQNTFKISPQVIKEDHDNSEDTEKNKKMQTLM